MQSCKHEEGYFCVNCWEKEGSRIWDVDEIQKFMIPPYATCRVSKEDPWPLGALLPTKDGRRTGNGCIVELSAEGIFTVLTDAGNTMRKSRLELTGSFHPPELVTDPERFKKVLRLANEDLLDRLAAAKSPLFGTADTLCAAKDYVVSLAMSSGNSAAVLTAVHVYANTLVETLLNPEDL